MKKIQIELPDDILESYIQGCKEAKLLQEPQDIEDAINEFIVNHIKEIVIEYNSKSQIKEMDIRRLELTAQMKEQVESSEISCVIVSDEED